MLGPAIAGALLEHGGLKACAVVCIVLVAIQTLVVLGSWNRWIKEDEIDSSEFHTPFCSPHTTPYSSALPTPATESPQASFLNP